MALKDILANILLKVQSEGADPLAELEAEIKKAEKAGDSANKQFSKTTRASQEVIRIVQDLPFGMMGITNNIQALSEAWADMSRKGIGGLEGIKLTAKSVLTGPMAISLWMAVLTGIALHFDKITAAAKNFAYELGLIDDIAFRIDRKAAKGAAVSYIESIIGDMSPDKIEAIRQEVIKLKKEQSTTFKAMAAVVGSSLGPAGAATSFFMSMFESGRSAVEMLAELQNKLGVLTPAMRDELLRLAVDLDVTTGTVESFTKALSEIEGRKIAQGLAGARDFALDIEQINLQDTVSELRDMTQIPLIDYYDNLTESIVTFSGVQVRVTRGFQQSAQQQAEVAHNQFQIRKRELRQQLDQAQMTQAEFAATINAEEALYQRRLQAITREEEERIRNLNLRYREIEVAFEQAAAEDWVARKRHEAAMQPTGSRRDQLQRAQQELAIEREIAEKKIQLDRETALQKLRSGQVLNDQELLLVFEHQRMLTQIQMTEEEKRLALTRKFRKEQFDAYVQGSQMVTSNASQAGQTFFSIWQENRERELDNLGKSEQEKQAILESEGKKRFEFMKKLMIAEAVANTFAASVAAFRQGMQTGGPVLAGLLMASTIAAGLAQVAKIHAMRIGGGASSGSTATGGGIGRFTQLSLATVNDRAAQFASNQTSDRASNTATAAAAAVSSTPTTPGVVVLEDKTAIQSYRRTVKMEQKYVR